MASHTNRSEADAFYYRGVDQGLSGRYVGCTVSYKGTTAYSYSTAVAKVIPTNKARGKISTREVDTGITLVSYNCMSKTTARHISLLRAASPFNTVAIPMKYGSSEVLPESSAGLLLSELDICVERINIKKFRDNFISLMEARNTIVSRACSEWAKAFSDRRFKKYESIDVKPYADKLKERNRKIAAKRTAEANAAIKKYAKGKSGKEYLDFLMAVFSGARGIAPVLSDREVKILREKLTANNRSYVWISGDELVTSKHIHVPLRDAAVLLKAWSMGHDMRKMMIGAYTIISYTGPEIRIGCHHIPRENMLALYEAVTGKKFPDRAGMRGDGE